jgi:hypothetical protein
LWFIVWASLGLLSVGVCRDLVQPVEGSEPPKFAFEEFYLVPLRIHLLQSKEITDLHCQLTEKDAQRILGKVNKIWAQGGVQFYLESVVMEDAANQEAYKSHNNPVPLDFHLTLRPEPSRAEKMFHVYYVHTMSVNGVYLCSDGMFVKDTASLREVEGGVDEPLPRVTAHELGHALGLPHRQDRLNLMASGTTGFSLNGMEIERVRAKVRAFDWVNSVTTIAQTADEQFHKKNVQEAKKLYARVVAIPGDSPLKELAKKRLDLLQRSKD